MRIGVAGESHLSYPKEGLTRVAVDDISVVSVMAESWGDGTDKDEDDKNDMEERDAWVERPVLSVVLYGAKRRPPRTTLAPLCCIESLAGMFR